MTKTLAYTGTLSLICAALLCPTDATAAECAGVRFTENLEVSGQKLVLNGMGLRESTVFKINVYVAALYVKDNTTDGEAIASAEEAKVLRLQFLSDVSRAKLRKAIVEGFKSTSASHWPTLEKRAAEFFALLPAFEKGQSLSLSYEPGVGLHVKAPGKGSAVIEGLDFSSALFRVWLGEHPASKKLKKGLLGGSCG